MHHRPADSFAPGKFSWSMALLMLASACAPQVAPSDGGVGNAGPGVIVDDAGNVSYTLVTVHVAGYLGKNLGLTIDGVQELGVPSDGVWRVPLSQPVATVVLEVSTQPTEPHQRCDVTKLDGNVFSILCKDQGWTVSGNVKGYAGKGLTLGLFDDIGDDLQDLPHSRVAIGENGTFMFPRALEDDTNYEVRILQAPTEPRQDCVITNPDGFADGFDITNVEIECTTKQYVFTSVVTGLTGKGLTIKTDVGEFPISGGTSTYTEAPYPDGFRYNIEIGHQPTDPAQLCYVPDGKGIIDGANVVYNVVCDPAGNLRIHEVGACPFSNSSCWFELINTGAAPETIKFYTVRTSSISPTAFTPSRVFSLPDVTVPSYGVVVIQGKTPGSIGDGGGVYHIADGDTVPWWSSDGFLELLTPAGATASFVRWGSNTIQPTTGGTYGGGAAAALPRGAGAFGSSIAQALGSSSNPPTGADYKLTAFATYGGPNDVFGDDDSDKDGIPDAAERPGGSFAGVQLYSMGARVGVRDVFVEVDRMDSVDPATIPRKEAFDKVVAAFSRRNIAVHFDAGNLYASTFDPSNYNLGGGNLVPFAKAIGLAPKDGAIKNLYDIKATNMVAARRMIFYYQLFAWSQQADGSGGSSGVGELPGNDSIITLGGFGLTANNVAQRNLIANYQAASVMHELGHNFGLRHGGGDQINRKPNYVSVMNYLYSPIGLPTIGSTEGDRYDYYKRCKLSNVTQLFNAPSGDVSRFMIDYSTGIGANMDESALRETVGLGRTGSQGVDFNCNGQVETAQYSRDLNNDGALDVLTDNNDWAALDFVFRRTKSGAEDGPSLLLADLQEHTDIATADTEHRTDEPCPAISVPDLSSAE